MQQVAQAPSKQEFNARDFRSALGAFPTGVTVVTTQGDDEPYGMTANAFSSVSLDPPLVLVCVARSARGREAIANNGVFAVNILSSDQEALSAHFASRERPRGPDAFADIPHRAGVTGAPLLNGTAAHLDCRVAAAHEAGDHTIFIGEVVALGHDPQAQPLCFHGGRYAMLRS